MLSHHTKPITLFIPHRFVGDCLMMTPILQQWAAQRPNEALAILAPPPLHPILSELPGVTLVMDYNSPLKAVFKAHPTIERVVITRPSMQQALTAKWLGAKAVFGFSAQKLLIKNQFVHWGVGLDKKVAHPVLSNQRHELDYWFDLMAIAGLTPNRTERQLLCPVPQNALEAFNHRRQTDPHWHLLADSPYNRPYVVVHWAAASRNKDVAISKLLPALQWLSQEKGYLLVLTGMPQHVEQYQALLPLLPPDKTLVLAGQTSLVELACLIANSQGLVGLDSAPLHMAAALGVPSIVGVYGAVSPVQWAPPVQLGTRFVAASLVLPCKPCLPKLCYHTQCRTALTPSYLFAQVQRAFK
jgi:ADP-heptose:LPS heptosyltransferase